MTRQTHDGPFFQTHPDVWRVSGLWVRVFMDSSEVLPASGWKLHISFGPKDYARAAQTVAEVLATEQVPFKLIRSARDLERLNDGAFGLLQVGKAVTVYPKSEQRAAALAETLTRALGETPGPPVATDCAYTPGGPVYFRFGPYDLQWQVDALGQMQRLAQHADGTSHRDTSDPRDWPARYFLPQTFPGDHLEGLRTHFKFLSVLHLSAKGGVFLARDSADPDAPPCVVKTAKRGAHLDLHGRDAARALAREHALLTRIRDVSGVPPAGDLYTDTQTVAIIRPHLSGISWRELWEQPDARTTAGRARMMEVHAELDALVARLHSVGIAVRDISPDNILVTPDGPVLLDLELAHDARDETPPYRRGTLGFYDPEEDEPDPFSQDHHALHALRFMFEKDAYPAWFHKGINRVEIGAPAAGATPKDTYHAALSRYASDHTPDAQNVYTGLAGMVLCACDADAPELLDGLGSLLRADELAHISGLYFGAPGIHLARAALGHATGDADLVNSASDTLAEWSHEQPNVMDIAHGRAGFAWACLTLGETLENDKLIARGLSEAEHIAAAATWQRDACCWPWPVDAQYGTLSGAALPGFAHGVSGIAYVLCRAHRFAPTPMLEKVLRGSAQFLHETARVVATDLGEGLWWSHDAQDRKVWNGWNHGTPGVTRALAAIRRTLPGACGEEFLIQALHGMGAANNGGYSLSQGVASRLDAYAEALPLLSQHHAEPFNGAANLDAAILTAIDAFALEASAGDPPPEGTGQGLMLGAPGVWLTLLRFRQRDFHGHRKWLP